ncbi:MAG: carboxypeptidase regulatory-like domain-containing protein, partial [Pyrinomonadaceae bacterium]
AVTSATLSGRVEDSTSAAVSGAEIHIINTERKQPQVVKSDWQGNFRFAYLSPGHYQIRITADGFQSVSTSLTLSVGQALNFPVKLEVRSVNTSVDITADAPLIETVRTQIAETIGTREIDNLPLNGRNYLDLALLAPNVSRTNTGANQRFAETSAVPGTGLSVAGGRNLNNSFIVDGLSANDDAADLAGTFYSQEVIREFQVITSGGIAEFGRASNGTFNIVTQSGTDEWHERFYGFFRNQRLDARNPLASIKNPFTQGQYGATAAGPLTLDRTFLFTNFEQTRQHNSGIITIAPANVAVINSRLDALNYAGPRITTGAFASGYNTTNFFTRVDHNLNDSNLLSGRYSFYTIESPNARTVGGINAISRGTSLDNRDQTLALNEVATLSPDSINELRFQYTRSRLLAPPNDLTGPAINILGTASLGTATFSPTARAIDLYELSDALTTQVGAHSLKVGVDFLLNRIDIEFPGSIQGVYTFSSLANFLTGNY